MIEIKNRKDLIKNGLIGHIRDRREKALDCLQFAINSVDPSLLVKRNIKIDKGSLRIGNSSFKLGDYKHVYVVGGGKASAKMAEALEEIMGNYITAGFVNTPHGTAKKTCIIELTEASHPIPDEAGVQGTLRMVELAEQAQKDDLIISLISGGGSSLMSLPAKGVALSDKKEITNSLLKSGAPITEVNIVRKHLSSFKGGWLAKKAFPATVLNIILSDVIGDQLDAIASGPTVPDPTTYSQAIGILQKYNLWLSAPSSIKYVLSNGAKGIIPETPKPNDLAFRKVYNEVIGNNKTAAKATGDCLYDKGLSTLLIANSLVGEARDAGRYFADLANNVFEKYPKQPIGIIQGGETTVTVKANGKGGRNQEFVLAAALNLAVDNKCVIASLSTDGIDGPTDAAGAIIDNSTIERAKNMGLDPYRFLQENDSYTFFSILGDLIFTGATGSNVNDLSVVLM